MTFPAAEDDPDPFQGQDAGSAMVGFALLALGLVESFSPLGAMYRLAGELVAILEAFSKVLIDVRGIHAS